MVPAHPHDAVEAGRVRCLGPGDSVGVAAGRGAGDVLGGGADPAEPVPVQAQQPQSAGAEHRGEDFGLDQIHVQAPTGQGHIVQDRLRDRRLRGLCGVEHRHRGCTEEREPSRRDGRCPAGVVVGGPEAVGVHPEQGRPGLQNLLGRLHLTVVRGAHHHSVP